MAIEKKKCRRCQERRPLEEFEPENSQTCSECKKIEPAHKDSEGIPCPGTLSEFHLNLEDYS